MSKDKNFFTVFYKGMRIENLSRKDLEDKLKNLDETGVNRYYNLMTHEEFIKFVKEVFKDDLGIEDIVCSSPDNTDNINMKFTLILNIISEFLGKENIPDTTKNRIKFILPLICRVHQEVIESETKQKDKKK